MASENIVDVMVDIETLGTKPGCVILSIAAVPFNVHSPLESFYMRIDKNTCLPFGFHIDDDTVRWWSKQSAVAQIEAFSGSSSIDVALEEFNLYLQQLGNVRLWGNGASFDVPIIEEAMRLCNIKPVWKYYNSMCFRTLKALFPTLIYVKPAVAHNALHDARAQAVHAEMIFKFLRS